MEDRRLLHSLYRKAVTKESAVVALILGGPCAGYLRHPFDELGVLRFIERAFLSKHMIGTYNHSCAGYVRRVTHDKIADAVS